MNLVNNVIFDRAFENLHVRTQICRRVGDWRVIPNQIFKIPIFTKNNSSNTFPPLTIIDCNQTQNINTMIFFLRKQ